MEISGFDWDEGNWPKCGKHGVLKAEIEKLFGGDISVAPDPYPIETEERYNAVGRNAVGRHIFVVFTYRERNGDILLRPISARYMHTKEVRRYEQGRKA